MIFPVTFQTKLDESLLKATKTQIEMFDNENSIIENAYMYRYIPYEQISPHLIHAFVSLEDKRFFSHKGIDYYRTLGALWKDIKTLSFKEGGSTITQQLAKNTLLSNEKTLTRKIKEFKLAKLIEKKYTKEQIIEMYLNAIYFGSGSYGIDSAAKNYFGKSPGELSPAESATLAGIVKNPSRYSPKIDPISSINRRNLVLKLMNEQGYINDNLYSLSLKETYTAITTPFINQICTPYYNNALTEASKILNIPEKNIVSGQYKIFTYYSPSQQNIVFRAINDESYACYNSNNIKADCSALLADNATAGISAYYTTVPYDIFSFKRQPASAIKPILVYAPAIDNGLISPITPVLDEKIDINGYSPKNYNNNYLGWISAESALSKSINTVAVKLFSDMGKENCFNFARKCGLTFNPVDDIASALGGLTDGLNIVELSQAYMTLANQGIYKNVTFIREIQDFSGKTLYQNKQTETIAMAKSTAFLTTQMLETTVKNGTASKLYGFPFAIASKTGTAQSTKSKNNLDAWNISYTTQNTLAIWYGDREKTNETAITTTGSGYPTLLARKIYSEIKQPLKKDFDVPNGVYKLNIDTFGLEKDHIVYLSNNFTPKIHQQDSYFSIKNCPTSISPYFDLNNVNFNIINTKDSRIVEISADEQYTYTLEEYELLSGNNTSYVFNQSGNFQLPASIDTANGIFSYKLYVSYNGELLGKISPKKHYMDFANTIVYNSKSQCPESHYR